MSITKHALAVMVLTLGCMTVSTTVSHAQAVTFSAATSFAAAMQPCSVAVGDFNGDGKQDLAAAYLRQPVTLTLPFKPRML